MDPRPSAPHPPAKFIEPLITPLQSLLGRPEVLVGRIAMLAVILLVALIAYALVHRVLRRLRRTLEAQAAAGPDVARRRAQRSLTVVSLLGSLANWAILLGALLWVLAAAGVNLVPVLAGAGVVGLAVGLGAQSLIRDFVSGLFLILDGQFAVGDYVKIDSRFGVVEQLSLRLTVLRDPHGLLHCLPNGSIGALTVYPEPRAAWGVDLPLAPEAVETARDALEGVLADLQREFPRQLLGWQTPQALELGAGQSVLQTTVDVFPEQQWVLEGELAPRWLQRLSTAGITLPEGVQPRVYMVLKVHSQRVSVPRTGDQAAPDSSA